MEHTDEFVELLNKNAETAPDHFLYIIFINKY